MYKDREKQREATAERVRRYRNKAKGVTLEEGVTEDVVPEALHKGKALHRGVTYFKDGVEMVRAEGMLVERPRYLTLSDGQILDRCRLPVADKSLPGMAACNRALRVKRGMSKQERLARLLQALDKDVTGLDGKRSNLLEKVRYGIGGHTLKEIQAQLKAT